MSYDPVFWHWLILASVLMGLEILVPGAFFLWLSLAAAASGIIKLVAPGLGPEVQYVLFAIFCILSLVGWKKFARKGFNDPTDQPALNQRNQRYLGRTLVLSEAIINGIGKVIVDDSQWKVTGTDAEVGTRVKVVKVDGSLLQVEPV